MVLALAACVSLGAVNAFGITVIGIPSFTTFRAIIAAVMIISAVCSGLAGMLGVAYFGSAQQNEFDTYLLDSIAAVVVGGTSLFGGQGGIGNTIIGLFVLGVLNNGLDHVNVDSFLKILIRGLILLVALIINVYAQRMRSRA